jgi:signal transduction histidine kinase
MERNVSWEIGLLGTIIVCLWMAVDTAQARAPLARRLPVVALAVAVGLWAAGEIGVWQATTPEGVLLARRALYAGTSLLAAAWLWSAAEAAQLPRLLATPARVALLALPPLAIYAQLYGDAPERFVHPTARPAIFGPLMWVYAAYSWTLVLIGTAGFLVAAHRAKRADPLRVAAIGLGSCVPLLGNMISLLGGATVPDSTPIVVGAGALVIRFFVLDGGLAGIVPIARRDVIDQLESAVLVADLAGVVVDANVAAERLLGEPVRGRRLDDVIAAAERDPARAIEVRRAPVYGRVGVVGAFAVLTDRTEARRAERQRLLGHKLESLGILTAGIAHEVNNPLAFVRSNLGALQELADALSDPKLASALPSKLQELAADAPDVVAECVEGVERIGRIVRRLRRFAREGGSGREPGLVSLAEVADKARALAAVGLAEDAVECRVRPAPPVLADEDELVQIAVNLLVNAIQASPRPPEIELEVGPERGGSRLVVRDRGAGIPEDAIPRIFDPFFTTKPPGEGTGLGLSLSFDLARQSGGTLEARNRPGGGAEFELWLPAAPPAG